MPNLKRCLPVLLMAMMSAGPGAAELRLNGLEDPLAANVRALLSIDDALARDPLPRPGRLRYLHRQADREIRTALEPFGYYNPELKLALHLEGPEAEWYADYRVNPGPRVLVGALRLKLEGEGAQDPVMQQVLEESGLRRDEPFQHQAYSALKSALQSRASERGYYDAVFTEARVLVDPDASLADIALVYDTGPRARIGQIHFDEVPVSEQLLRRYLPFGTGDPINTAQLVMLQRNLIDSNYFSDVEVRPLLPQREDGVVPVDIGLTPNARTLYQGGAGFGTDTGARLQIGTTRRWVNRRGHSLDSRLRLSQVKQAFNTSYQIPGEDPVTDRFALNIKLEDEQSDTIDARTYGIGGSWQKKLNGWDRRLALDWQQEAWVFEGDEQESTLLLPSVRFSKTQADDRINTRRGYSLDIGLTAAAEPLLSDTNLIQLEFGGKRVDSLGERWRLLTRAELGLTLVDSVDDLPASMRFYAGGDTSVRGYDYQSLGPTGAGGDVLGGRYLVTGSVEVDYKIRDKWRVAAFLDTGNAFDDIQADLKTGAGIGARWQSPVGPVRLDLAVPLDDSGFRIHFSLGPDL